VLRQENGIGKSNITKAENRDLHSATTPHCPPTSSISKLCTHKHAATAQCPIRASTEMEQEFCDLP